MTGPLDLPPAERSPAEQLAELRAQVEDQLAKFRTRRATRTALFVGGPYHGTLRALPDPAPDSLPVPIATGPVAAAELGEPVTESASYTMAVYTRQKYATAEVDGWATVDVWAYDGNPTPPAHAEVSDAALRVLIRTGLLDHRFQDLSDREMFDGAPGQRHPDLRDRVRCTPEPAGLCRVCNQPRTEPARHWPNVEHCTPERYPDIIVQALARDLANQARRQGLQP